MRALGHQTKWHVSPGEAIAAVRDAWADGRFVAHVIITARLSKWASARRRRRLHNWTAIPGARLWP